MKALQLPNLTHFMNTALPVRQRHDQDHHDEWPVRNPSPDPNAVLFGSRVKGKYKDRRRWDNRRLLFSLHHNGLYAEPHLHDGLHFISLLSTTTFTTCGYYDT